MGKPALLYPNIEAERARRGWTVDELLEKINVKSRKTYYNWCRSGEIPLKKLNSLADVLECSPDYLLGFKQDKRKEET